MANEIIIEVRSTQLDRLRPYNNKHYGEQGCAIFNGGDYPLPIKVNVEQGHEYPPGQYTIDPRSFTRDDMGNLKIKGLRLLPLGGSSKPTPK
ncbi:single-stranded DNA-binding protein [Pseudomonas sp. CGJS7]|uniref:single-stranded DNA-binding protein n=1 Tax=Pseudomonas sp. CGJS7 TaxID=3109348 RepID=UPI00300B57C3